MKEPKLTPWFPADVKPVHVGVYRTRMDERELGPYYNRWDGKKWRASATTIEMADYLMLSSTIPLLQWRGLAEKPV